MAFFATFMDGANLYPVMKLQIMKGGFPLGVTTYRPPTLGRGGLLHSPQPKSLERKTK
jgi:hypothetical protein